jgi:hypothetical protein
MLGHLGNENYKFGGTNGNILERYEEGEDMMIDPKRKTVLGGFKIN